MVIYYYIQIFARKHYSNFNAILIIIIIKNLSFFKKFINYSLLIT